MCQHVIPLHDIFLGDYAGKAIGNQYLNIGKIFKKTDNIIAESYKSRKIWMVLFFLIRSIRIGFI